MRASTFGKIFGVVLALGAAVAITMAFRQSSSPVDTSRSVSAPLPASEWSSRLEELDDSLSHLDLAIELKRVTQGEVPADLLRRQEELWERHTWVRTRLAALDEPSLPPTADSPSLSQADFRPGGLTARLQTLSQWLWVAVGASLLSVIGLILLLRGRTREPAPRYPSEPPTFIGAPEPTLTRLRRSPAGGVPLTQPPAGSPGMAVPRTPSTWEAEPSPSPPLPGHVPTGDTGALENTSLRTPPPAATEEPSVVQDYVISMAKRGRTPAEIARRLRIPQDQVQLILKLRRQS